MSLLALLLGIIGGQPSSDAAVVCITADTLPVCTGSLIGKRTVLTAGHCAYPLGQSVSYFAAFGPDCRAPLKRVKLAEMITHPMYSGEGKPFDLAVARLERDADAAPLALSTVGLSAGAAVRHVGYGSSQESPMDGWGTQRAATHAVTRADADFYWSGDAVTNTCIGDSGAPMLSEGAVAAVASDGPDCHSDSADVRLDVTRAWVEEQLAAFEPAEPRTGCSQAPAAALLALLLPLVDLARRLHHRARHLLHDQLPRLQEQRLQDLPVDVDAPAVLAGAERRDVRAL